MIRKRIWIYGIILFLIAGGILATQVLWVMQTARLEESLINQRVNWALCNAMDVLAKDKDVCTGVQSCISRSNQSFELRLNDQDKAKIDSVIAGQLRYYHMNVPFESSFASYSPARQEQLTPEQALLYPVSSGAVQNVLVNLKIPSKNELVRKQLGGTFVLAVLMLIVLAVIFISVLKALSRESAIRKETVDLVNTMAHDLKTPISNISLALALINKENPDNTISIAPYINAIGQETNRLKQRARQILGLASVDAILEEVSVPMSVNIHEVIKEIANSFQLKLNDAKGKLEMNLTAKYYHLYANKIQLVTAFNNIIDNAIKYSGESPKITIETRDKKNGLEISIADRGPGIPEKDRHGIFEKGYRIENGSDGFGLGLYLAKTLIEKQKGSIELDNRYTSGCRFNIWLPSNHE